MSTAIILFAHGARDPGWAAPVHELAVRLHKAGVRAEPAFLEHMQPDLESAVDSIVSGGVTDILIAPLFLAQGAHLKRDLPAQIEAMKHRHPGLAFRVAPALGDDETVLAAIVGSLLGQMKA